MQEVYWLVAEAAFIGERSNRPDALAADEPPRIAKRIDKDVLEA
jgi:hypothetical protein